MFNAFFDSFFITFHKKLSFFGISVFIIPYKTKKDRAKSSFFLQNRLILFAFKNTKHHNADDNGGDENILLFGEFLFKENSGEKKGNNANAGDDGSGNGAVSAHCVNVSKLTCGFANGGDCFVFMFRNFKFNAFDHHEDEEDDAADCEGEFIGNVCDKFDVFFVNADKGAGFHFKEIDIEEASESIDDCVAEGHCKSDYCKSFAKAFSSFNAGSAFGIAYADDTDNDYCDCDPDDGVDGFAKENYAKMGAHCTRGVFNGVGKGFFDESDSEEGTGHGNNIAKGNRQIGNKVHRVIIDVGSQQSEDCVDSHYGADHNANS